MVVHARCGHCQRTLSAPAIVSGLPEAGDLCGATQSTGTCCSACARMADRPVPLTFMLPKPMYSGAIAGACKSRGTGHFLCAGI